MMRWITWLTHTLPLWGALLGFFVTLVLAVGLTLQVEISDLESDYAALRQEVATKATIAEREDTYRRLQTMSADNDRRLERLLEQMRRDFDAINSRLELQSVRIDRLIHELTAQFIISPRPRSNPRDEQQ